MGCDIHVLVEVRSGDNRFHPYQNTLMYIPRDYNLFALLANVRNYGKIKPIDTPRGLPSDVCSYVREMFDDIDLHSHSWIDEYEYRSHVRGMSQALDGLVDYSAGWLDESEIRIIFAFDN